MQIVIVHQEYGSASNVIDHETAIIDRFINPDQGILAFR